MSKQFEISETINQMDFLRFKSAMMKNNVLIEEQFGSSNWAELPTDVVYHYFAKSALESGWATGEITADELDSLPVPNDVGAWGKAVFDKYIEIMQPDPK